MNWRVILATFGMIFLAELGDKTRLAAMTLAAQIRRPWGLIGASIALACVSAIGVAVIGILG
jgi:Ca2+/H+ antiporter, TMEM165/GDT1 family